MSSILRTRVGITLFLAAIVFILIHMHLFNPKQENPYDSGENLVGAFTIAEYNTYSINAEPHPASKREPFFPFLLSVVIKMKSYFVAHADHWQAQTIENINRLQLINILILFTTICICFLFVYTVTKNYFVALYGLISLIFSGALAQSAHTFLSEIVSAFLCVIIAILLFFSKKWLNKNYYYIALALVLSALVLTKAIYLYFIPIISIYLIARNFQKLKVLERASLKNMMVFTGCLFIVVGGWMLRNYLYFDRIFIADRKAEVLSVRAEFNSVPSDVYPYLYVIWTPGLSKYYLSENHKSLWSRVVNEQIILDAYNHQLANFFQDKKMNPNGSYNQDDYLALEKIAIQRIIQNPLGHIKLTFAFLYRSIFIEDGSGLEYLGLKLPRENNDDKRVDSVMLAALVNFPGWLSLLYITFYLLRKRDLALLGLVLLPIYTVLVYSFFAFSHHRYLLPMVPLLTMLTCLTINILLIRNSRTEPPLW